MSEQNKPRLQVTVDKENLNWIDQKVKENIFANRSHAINRAVTKLRESGGV